MDKVFDFFKDLKERISSPFFSSFIISWIPLNWMFLNSIFKYDVTGFTLFYYSLYLEYTYSLLNYWNSLIIPFILAILYSFGYPFLRSWIEIADVWFKTNANDKKIEVSKSSKITIEKYMKLREIYERRTKTLEEVLEKEKETIERNEQLINELNLLRQENNELRISLTDKTQENNDFKNEIVLLKGSLDSEKIKLSKYQEKEELIINKYKVEYLNGNWNATESNTLTNSTKDMSVSIDNGKVYILNSDGFGQEWFTITNYTFNNATNNIEIFAKTAKENYALRLIFKINEDSNTLSGVNVTNSYMKYLFSRKK